jgi:CBS domain-containing protein
MIRIQEAMTRHVHITNPSQSIRDAACMMAEVEAGAISVGEDDRLVGMITDRDIAIRAVALGKGPETPVRDIMGPGVCSCFEDQEVDEVAVNMADVKLRRLPEFNRDERLVGIISLGEIALADDASVSEPGGEHSHSSEISWEPGGVMSMPTLVSSLVATLRVNCLIDL